MLPVLISIAFIGIALALVLLSAAWAGMSNRHWFPRTTVVCGALVALYPIRALEPILWLAAAAPLTAWLAGVIRRRCSPSDGEAVAWPSGFRFGLINVFLAMLLAGVLSALASGILREPPEIHWQHGVVVAVCATLVLLCVWFVHARGRRRSLAALVILLVLVAGVVACLWTTPRSLPFQLINLAPTAAQLAGGSVLYGSCLLLTLLLLTVSRLATDRRPMVARLAAVRAVCALSVILVPTGIVYMRMLKGRPVPPVDYAAANSFDETMSLIELATTVGTNATGTTTRQVNSAKGATMSTRSLYENVLHSLETPGHVQLDMHRHGRAGYVEDVLVDAQAVRSFARMLDGQAQAEIAVGKHDEASRYALGNMQLGNTLARGGIGIHSLVGVAVETIGGFGLARVRGDVSSARAAELIEQLERLRDSREPLATTMARDAAFGDSAFTWGARLEHATAWLLGEPDATVPLTAAAAAAMRRRDAMLELLVADLAVRLHTARHGRPPRGVEELVPEFLEEVPLDPYSGKPVILRVIDGQPVVYCVGPDGRDDGGRFGAHDVVVSLHGYDLDLDCVDR